MIMAGERGISLNVMRSCWLNSASISRCGSTTSHIWGVMHGDLGISLKSRLPVWDEFVPRFKRHWSLASAP